MSAKDDQTDSDEKFQSIKYLSHLHQQYDDALKEGELVQQRLADAKELAHDLERWVKNIPNEPADEQRETYESIDDVKIIPFTIPIRTYLEEGGDW